MVSECGRGESCFSDVESMNFVWNTAAGLHPLSQQSPIDMSYWISH